MLRARLFLAGLVLLLMSGFAFAADLPLESASGTIIKANANVLIMHPRNAEGQFGKALTLKIRGTSKLFALSAQMRKGQVVLVQNETEATSLRANQRLAVIFTQVKNDYVLLEAVVQPGGGR